MCRRRAPIRRCGLRLTRANLQWLQPADRENSAETDVVAAKAEGAPYHPAPSRSGASAAGGTASPSSNPTHARELQPHTVQPAPSSGNDSADKKYQQQQQKLVDKQNQEHQKLQTQQDKEDQQITKQNNQQRQQMVEQKHTQQTQELEQKHTQQQQQLQTRAPAPRPAPRKPEK
jgi:hypothetical protein